MTSKPARSRLEATDGPNGVKLEDSRDPIALVKSAVDKETAAMEALAKVMDAGKNLNPSEKGGTGRLAAIEAAQAKLSDVMNNDRRQDRANKGRNTATLKFKLVSDNDLVAEIENQEGAEGGPYDRLDTMLKTLNATRDTLGQVVKEWSDKPDGDQFDAMIARTETASYRSSAPTRARFAISRRCISGSTRNAKSIRSATTRRRRKSATSSTRWKRP